MRWSNAPCKIGLNYIDCGHQLFQNSEILFTIYNNLMQLIKMLTQILVFHNSFINVLKFFNNIAHVLVVIWMNDQ